MDPLLNDLKFTFDDNKHKNKDDDKVYEALITKLEIGEGVFNTDNLNPFGYGYNNPISFDDPDGRCPICVYVIAALLYSEFANAPTVDSKLDSTNYEASRENKTIVIRRGTPGLGNSPAKEKTIDRIKSNTTNGKEKHIKPIQKSMKKGKLILEKLVEKEHLQKT